jgi:hypothetical protein
MDLEKIEARNDGAGEGQQQFKWTTDQHSKSEAVARQSSPDGGVGRGESPLLEAVV